MKSLEALELLRQAAELAKLSKQEHVLLEQAYKLIKSELSAKKELEGK